MSFHSLLCVGVSFSQFHSVYGRLEALGHDRQDMKWDDDTDWGKLFTEGGDINETCVYSSSSPC